MDDNREDVGSLAALDPNLKGHEAGTFVF